MLLVAALPVLGTASGSLWPSDSHNHILVDPDLMLFVFRIGEVAMTITCLTVIFQNIINVKIGFISGESGDYIQDVP